MMWGLCKRLHNFICNKVIKNWICPITRHGGAYGGRIYSSYSFLTSALDGGERSASRPSHALAPGKGPPVPIVQEAGWASACLDTEVRGRILFASAGDWTSISRSFNLYSHTIRTVTLAAKKIIATQKLNANYCKQQRKKFLLWPLCIIWSFCTIPATGSFPFMQWLFWKNQVLSHT
jgi:hypothetical protein